MATMVVEIYDALRSIGVAEDKATKAAEAMATLEPQFAAMRSDIRVLKWQVGSLIAVQALVGVPAVVLLLRVAIKVGAFG
jgi:hypothetical protein